MGYADRSYSYSPGRGSGGLSGGGGGLLGSFSMTPWVRRLLVANGAVWLLNSVGLLPHEWTVRHFGFSLAGFLTHPWSPVTYMFVHAQGFLHIFFNMIVLFFFGPPLERAWGGRAFLKFYVVAGVGAALMALLLWPVGVVPAHTPVVGASGAIYGVMLAFALSWPDAQIYIWGILPIRAKWFVTIIAGLAFFSTVSLLDGGGGGVAHWAHLGGLVAGFAYLRWGQGLARVIDPAFERLEKAVASVRRLARRALPDGPSGGTKRSPRSRRQGGGREIRFPGGKGRGEEHGEEQGRGRQGAPDDPRADEDTLDEVDRILDKIREKGLESLTEEERAFLDEMSRRYRN